MSAVLESSTNNTFFTSTASKECVSDVFVPVQMQPHCHCAMRGVGLAGLVESVSYAARPRRYPRLRFCFAASRRGLQKSQRDKEARNSLYASWSVRRSEVSC